MSMTLNKVVRMNISSYTKIFIVYLDPSLDIDTSDDGDFYGEINIEFDENIDIAFHVRKVVLFSYNQYCFHHPRTLINVWNYWIALTSSLI